MIFVWEYNYTDELYHHGVKGMKWGVRRTPQQLGHDIKKSMQKRKQDHLDYRRKMAKVSNNRYAHSSDKARAKYAAKSMPAKVASVTFGVVFQRAILKGITGQSQAISKDEAKQIAKEVVKNMAINEAMGKSVSKKYDDQGKFVGKKKQGLYTREDLYTKAMTAATIAAPIAGRVAGMKYSKMKAERYANEQKFNAWKGNILEAKFDDIVPGNFRVID